METDLLPKVIEESSLELDFGPEAVIPCQCVHIEGYNGGHALHFIYFVPIIKLLFPPKKPKFIPFEEGHPKNDVYPECTSPAEYRVTFKGRYPGLGRLKTSSFTLCEPCLQWWWQSKACAAYEQL